MKSDEEEPEEVIIESLLDAKLLHTNRKMQNRTDKGIPSSKRGKSKTDGHINHGETQVCATVVMPSAAAQGLGLVAFPAQTTPAAQLDQIIAPRTPTI